ncbi:UNVERIFIED_CONTAM: hypothetical protein HDU68_002955 [Siphonaria sp. JEL0065]|nr:hypothetical protein HDU68_002955 [Siphonaria sp. JEL0065]
MERSTKTFSFSLKNKLKKQDDNEKQTLRPRTSQASLETLVDTSSVATATSSNKKKGIDSSILQFIGALQV